jgi:hypothetical protein
MQLTSAIPLEVVSEAVYNKNASWTNNRISERTVAHDILLI